MKELRIDTGVVEYTLNDKCTVSFNPTDMEFVNRVNGAFEELDHKQEEWKAQVETAKKAEKFSEIYEFSKERDREMREIIDRLFDKPICTELFGDLNVYAYAGGMPVWANLLLALVDEINDVSENENKISSQKVKKYTEKYRK